MADHLWESKEVQSQPNNASFDPFIREVIPNDPIFNQTSEVHIPNTTFYLNASKVQGLKTGKIHVYYQEL